MQQANKLFILSEVADHIVASLESVGNTVKIIMRHRDDTAPNRLQITVDRMGKEFIIAYDAVYNGERITQAKSDPVPAALVQMFISQIANDTIPAGAVA